MASQFKMKKNLHFLFFFCLNLILNYAHYQIGIVLFKLNFNLLLINYTKYRRVTNKQKILLHALPDESAVLEISLHVGAVDE